MSIYLSIYPSIYLHIYVYTYMSIYTQVVLGCAVLMTTPYRVPAGPRTYPARKRINFHGARPVHFIITVK